MEEKTEQNLEAEAQNAIEVYTALEAFRFMVGMFNDASRKVMHCELSDLETCYGKAKSLYITLNLLYDDIQHKVEISNILDSVKEFEYLRAGKALLDTTNMVMDMTYEIRKKDKQ